MARTAYQVNAYLRSNELCIMIIEESLNKNGNSDDCDSSKLTSNRLIMV